MVTDPMATPAAPPFLTDDGEPIPCPRCGRIYERPLPGLTGHVPGSSQRLCPPMTGTVPRDARERKARRRGL